MQTDEQPKTISFEGTNNRYKMKKLVDNSSTPKIKKDAEKWDFHQNVYGEDMQKLVLKELCEESVLCRESSIAKREIEKKLHSYKQQDIIKSRFSESEFISFENVIDELKNSKLLCHYCSCFMFLMYEHVREMKQWTLDRIDNSIGHNQGNVVVSCLKCNLQRRKTNQAAFLFTKNLNIVKSNNISC
jgi:hypothetical protein